MGVRALVHMALREDKEAEADFQHSLHLDNNNSETNNNYRLVSLPARARTRVRKAISAALKNPLYATPEKAYLNAGICSMKVGELKDANEFMQKALLLQPNMPEAQLGMAEIAFANGNYEEAKSNFSRFEEGGNANFTPGKPVAGGTY